MLIDARRQLMKDGRYASLVERDGAFKSRVDQPRAEQNFGETVKRNPEDETRDAKRYIETLVARLSQRERRSIVRARLTRGANEFARVRIRGRRRCPKIARERSSRARSLESSASRHSPRHQTGVFSDQERVRDDEVRQPQSHIFRPNHLAI